MMMSARRYGKMKNTAERVAYVFTGILAIAFVVLLIMYIILPLISFLILLITDLIFLLILLSHISKRNRSAHLKCSIIFTVILSLCALFWSSLHMPITVRSRWQYPLALSYTYNFKSVDTFLPKKLPKSAKKVRYEFFPTILQGDGYLCVEFTADDQYVTELKARLEEEAMYVVDYKDLGILNKSIQEDSGTYDTVQLHEGTFADKHPDSTVYIIDNNFYWNHPRSKVVFIDGNYVYFAEE